VFAMAIAKKWMLIPNGFYHDKSGQYLLEKQGQIILPIMMIRDHHEDRPFVQNAHSVRTNNKGTKMRNKFVAVRLFRFLFWFQNFLVIIYEANVILFGVINHQIYTGLYKRAVGLLFLRNRYADIRGRGSHFRMELINPRRRG